MIKVGKPIHVATINENDNVTALIIKIYIQGYKDEDGLYFDLVSSNYENIEEGGHMTKQQALGTVLLAWNSWKTFIVNESDLATRERVNLVLDAEMMANLRKLSKKTSVPMSRMVDKAIMEMYGKEMLK